MNKSIEKILADIITHELNLPPFYGKNERGDIIPCVVCTTTCSLININSKFEKVPQVGNEPM